MVTFSDFDVQAATTADVSQLVDVFKISTNDEIYDKLAAHFEVNFKALIRANCGGFQVARLKAETDAPIAGLALFKLRLGGYRDPLGRFAATPQQKELHAKLFPTARSPISEVTGDPIFTRFSDVQNINEVDEDVLSKDPTSFRYSNGLQY
jgi:hypothetical protein